MARIAGVDLPKEKRVEKILRRKNAFMLKYYCA